ncbi:MAG: hypothetical protein K0U15_05790 [Proteobacteria bacterium]|nr:hypothetical protein [Pseudomonadota bacterium]
MSENNTPEQKKQEHSAPENKIPSKFDLYKIALETRNFEIELFWKRSNYFLVLNTAIAVGFFNLESNQAFFKIFLCIFGGIVTYLWIRINLGSKYWQVKWEEELKQIEKQINPKMQMFDNEQGINDDLVYKNLFSSSKREENNYILKEKCCGEKILDDSENWLKQRIYKCVLKKPSVSFTMILLSLLFIIGWILLLIFSVA